MKVNLQSLLSEIRQGKPPSLLLLHGDDFRMGAAVQALADSLVPAENRAFNLERFDGRSVSWDQVEASLMTPPFFPGIKLVWVEDAPYFATAENKTEMGEKVFRLWTEGKKDEATRALIELLDLEGWTQERWDRLDVRSAIVEIAALLGGGDKEAEAAEALLAHCRGRDIEMRSGRDSGANRLMEFLEQGVPSWSVLLLAATHVDRRARLYKRFVEKGAALDLTIERDRSGKIDGATLAQFLDRRLREAGKRIEPRAREAILARAGTQLWTFHQEVEKLLLYVGAESSIRENDVEEILLDQGEGWVFDLTKALAARDSLAALGQLARLLSQGNHPLALLGPIANEVRRLFIARQLMEEETGCGWRSGMSFEQFRQKVLGQDAPALSGNPYAVYMSFKNAENFTAGELARDLDLLYQTDIRLKSTGNPPRILIERLILEMCRHA